MKKRTRLMWIGLLALGVVQTVLGQGPLRDLPGGKWWMNKGIVQKLQLRREQQGRIEALWLQSRRPLAEQKAEVDRRQQELLAILARDAIDEAAAMKAFDEMLQARHNLERTTFLMRIQIKKLLTREQQPIIEAIAERMRLQKNQTGASTATESPVLPIKK